MHYESCGIRGFFGLNLMASFLSNSYRDPYCLTLRSSKQFKAGRIQVHEPYLAKPDLVGSDGVIVGWWWGGGTSGRNKGKFFF